MKVTSKPTREPWLLARARHANIVEIVSHAMVDDGAYQLICMPFWGGATLTAVLAEGRRRPGPPVSGTDLLADLDSVAAPEYPAVHSTRLAREILAHLSYEQAVAWIIARLAEALEHAFSRDVAHGDVKPSNILLSADGTPMLLDFNLARDGQVPGSKWSSADPGGTLAYMAPERLRNLAIADPVVAEMKSGRLICDRDLDSQATPSDSADPLGDRGPHLADIYALGMVLLEALTVRPPLPIALADEQAPQFTSNSLRTEAIAYSVSRVRDADTLICESESSSGRRIPAGLRVILERCLDPDPTLRYQRAWELAEDLERWRTDRMLAFAREPFWHQTVPRCLRRQRKLLVWFAAAASLLIGLPTTVWFWISSERSGEKTAFAKLARHWDDAEAGEYRSQRPLTSRILAPGDPQVVETALRVLKDYGVVGPNNSVQTAQDWRRREDVRLLPASIRDDFELWLMEQTYRYCRGLEDRPNQSSDWLRALEILERVPVSSPLQAFAVLSQRLHPNSGCPIGRRFRFKPSRQQCLPDSISICEAWRLSATPPSREIPSQSARRACVRSNITTACSKYARIHCGDTTGPRRPFLG